MRGPLYQLSFLVAISGANPEKTQMGQSDSHPRVFVAFSTKTFEVFGIFETEAEARQVMRPVLGDPRTVAAVPFGRLWRRGVRSHEQDEVSLQRFLERAWRRGASRRNSLLRRVQQLKAP